MNICQHVPVLFLLLLAAGQASTMSSEGEEKDAFDLGEIRQRLEEIEQRQIQEGDFGRELVRVSESMDVESANGSNSNIKSDSTLNEVNQELERIRTKFYEDNPNAKPADVNNHALAALGIAGYLENNLLSKVDEAIKEGYYAFLKSLYPATKMIWWNDENLALLLAKAYGRTEWMSEDEWEQYSKDEGVDWKLRFRTLIRSGNEHIYKNEGFRDMIFKNETYKKTFRGTIQEAYGSGNTAFLKAVPYPSEEFPLVTPNAVFSPEEQAVFFWSFAYGQEWCSDDWRDYIDTVKDIDGALKASNIFDHDNPKVFKHKRVKTFLGSYGISDTLETAIEWDSLSFAKYLKEKYGEEKFKEMVMACSEVYTLSKTFSSWGRETFYRFRKGRLSRIYNLLLENGRKFERDASSIQFRDVPILGKEHLLPLLKSGFSKVPLSRTDFGMYGATTTSIEFLKMILNDKYKVDGKTWKEWKEWQARDWWRDWSHKEFGTWEDAWSDVLVCVGLNTHDAETLKLISVHLDKILDSENPAIDDDAKRMLSDRRIVFYRKWIDTAIRKGDIKLTDIISTIAAVKEEGLTFDSIFSGKGISPTRDAFSAAAKGDLTILNWIFDFKPELLEIAEWKSFSDFVSYSSPSYVPFLKYLFKKSKEKELPSYMCLADYAKCHLSRAIKDGDFDHYKEVCEIEGVTAALKEHNFEIPAFPVNG